MSHTNSTPNYSLPQFLPTDKPFWLTDINGAFSAIDTAIDAAKDAADNAQNDATQALTDAGSASSAASAADAKGAGAVSSLADAYDATATYSIDDLVTYNNLLYKNISAITTPEAWDGSHWSRVTIEDQLNIKADQSDVATALAAKANASDVTDIFRNLRGNAPINVNDCVPGYVYWASTYSDPNYQNLPSTGAYTLITFKPISTHGFQVAVQNGGGRLWIRTVGDNLWSNWKYIDLT